MMGQQHRILATHTGSLGRAPEVRDLLIARAERKPVDENVFREACKLAVAKVVQRQCEIGLDIINDGEQSKTGFAQYVHERLSGFDGTPISRIASLEARQFPGAPTGTVWQTPCTGPLAWRNFSAVERDIENLKATTAGLSDKTVFMTSVSPGSFTNNNPNQYYPSRSKYLEAVAEVMRLEYEAIASAGFLLQLDSPDLAQRSYNFPDMPVAEWRSIVAENIEAMNWATREIPREQIRVHVCWGANEGPHNHDTELKDIIDLLLKLRTSAISVVAANGRHEHEWRVWENVSLPENLAIIPGVIDSTTNIIEHPRTVADRVIRMARIIGRDRIIAGVDCGFGTSGTAVPKVHPEVAWSKLEALVEGVRLANHEL